MPIDEEQVFTIKDKWDRTWEIERGNLTLIHPATILDPTLGQSSRYLTDEEAREADRMLAKYKEWCKNPPAYETVLWEPRVSKYCPTVYGGMGCSLEKGHRGQHLLTEEVAILNYDAYHPERHTVEWKDQHRLQKEQKQTKRVQQQDKYAAILADLKLCQFTFAQLAAKHEVSREYVRSISADRSEFTPEQHELHKKAGRVTLHTRT